MVSVCISVRKRKDCYALFSGLFAKTLFLRVSRAALGVKKHSFVPISKHQTQPKIFPATDIFAQIVLIVFLAET